MGVNATNGAPGGRVGIAGAAGTSRLPRVSARDHDEQTEIIDAEAVEEGGALDVPLAPPVAVREPAALPARSALPVAQAAAVAVSGFAAGALTAVVVHSVGKRRVVKAAARKPGKPALPVLGTRSFLVDVHLLGGKD